MKFNKTKEAPFYTPSQIEKRNEEIPSATFLPGSTKRTSFSIGFSDWEESIDIGKTWKKSLPASIEYLPFQRERGQKFDVFEDEETQKGFMDMGSKISRAIKHNFAGELEQPQDFQFDVADGNLKDLTQQPEIASEEFLNLNLASDAKVDELTKLHMDLYSVLSRVQEVRIASDLKAAYDIQDRISYVLDNRSLLLDDLVDKLIDYLKNIVQKLSDCERKIRSKQVRFSELNSRVSKLKEYKYKTDLSFQLLDNNKAEIESEIDRNLKILKEETIN